MRSMCTVLGAKYNTEVTLLGGTGVRKETTMISTPYAPLPPLRETYA